MNTPTRYTWDACDEWARSENGDMVLFGDYQQDVAAARTDAIDECISAVETLIDKSMHSVESLEEAVAVLRALKSEGGK